MTKKHLFLPIAFIFCFFETAYGETIHVGESAGMPFQVEEVASGLGIVWGLAFLSPEELLVTERDGRIRIVNPQTGRMVRLLGVPKVWHRDQGGLLDVAVPSDFTRGDWIYFTYSKDVKGRGATTLARAHLEEDRLIDWQELLVTRSLTDTGRHFGSRITFDEENHLFFSVGDRGVRPNGQDLSTHAGTIIRLHRDGKVPKDNPFVRGGGLPEIWSYGHRNPQGLFWDERSGRLWSNEHGPRGGDEINLIEPGENYGWAVVSHGKEYWGPLPVGEATSKPGMKDPLKIYTPSIAPGSLIVYSGEAFPGWKGNLFAGALALVHLNRVVFDDDGVPVEEERLLAELDERIRDVIEGPQGFLYVSTDSGRILRIRPFTK